MSFVFMEGFPAVALKDTGLPLGPISITTYKSPFSASIEMDPSKDVLDIETKTRARLPIATLDELWLLRRSILDEIFVREDECYEC